MTHLILVRHGYYAYGHLSGFGRDTIRELAGKLRPFVANGARVLILTSTADRARESAEILGAAFGVGYEDAPVLYSGPELSPQFPETLSLIKDQEGRADVMILITHCEYTDDLPEHFSVQKWGARLTDPRERDPGEAVVLNCVERTVTYVP